MQNRLLRLIKGNTLFTCIAFMVLFYLVLLIPIKSLLHIFDVPEPDNNGKSIKGLFVIVGSFFLISNLLKSTSFLRLRIARPAYLLVPIIYPLSLALINIHAFPSEVWSSFSFWIYVVSVAITAIAEEFACRGFLFYYLFEKSEVRKSYLRPALYSSAAFALMHITNLTQMDMGSVMLQVFFAFCFGVFFCALIVKLQNIYVLGLIHGVFNFFMSPTNSFRRSSEVTANTGDTAQGFVEQIMIFGILFLPLFILGVFILRRHKLNIEI